MAGWQDDQRSHRRFPHRSRKQAGGHGESFQPRNMLGRYTLRSAFFDKLRPSSSNTDPEQELWLEIHELVESETGYLATFDLGAMTGVMLIAGSRKGLRAVVEAAEESEEEDSEEEQDDGEESTAYNNEAEEQADDSSFLPAPEDDRPAHAFEKNTFRTPKWFAQWRGQLSQEAASMKDSTNQQNKAEEHDSSDDNVQQEAVSQYDTSPDNKAHFEFSSAACRDFKATFSCPALGAKEVAVQGWKVTGKSSTSTISWSHFAP